MKIAVCLKQVPDMESKFIVIDEQKIDESQFAFMINDFDKYAVETALQLKEQFNGEITIITIGPDRAAKDIRHALAMGADKGIHINDKSLYNKDNLITATALAKAIEDVGDIDIILTGAQAEDNQAAQTGIMISDILKIASCSNIVKLSVSDDSKTITLNRELEGGYNEILNITTPALLTIQSGINEPRHPTLPNIIKAKKKPIDIKTAADLDIDTIGHTSLVKMYTPKNNSKAEMLEGDIETVARSLIKKLTTDVAVI